MASDFPPSLVASGHLSAYYLPILKEPSIAKLYLVFVPRLVEGIVKVLALILKGTLKSASRVENFLDNQIFRGDH